MAKLNKRILNGLKVNEIYSRKIYEQTWSDFSYFVIVSPGLFVISRRPLPFMSPRVRCLFILCVLPSSIIRFVLASIKHRIICNFALRSLS